MTTDLSVRGEEVVTEEGEVLKLEPVSALESQTRAEIDVQIATAKRYPRNVKKFIGDTLSLATLTPEVAASCCFAKPGAYKPSRERGKPGEREVYRGPSVRLAEIAATCYGNMRTGVRIVREEQNYLVAQAFAIDVEKNVGFSVEVRRNLTKQDGGRYSESMVATTAQAAMSIATRNAIFRVIPRALIDPIYQRCLAVAAGEGQSIEDLRKKWIPHFIRQGITKEEVYAALGVPGREDVGLEEIEKLIAFDASIKNHEASLDDIFRPALDVEVGPARSRAEVLEERLRERSEPREPGDDDE